MKSAKITGFIALTALLVFGLVPGRKVLAAEDLLCSTFPVYLFTRSVSEGRQVFEIKLMLDSALGCPHDYAPTPADLNRLSQAKFLVINGLGMESFLGRALSVAREDLQVIDASGGTADKAAPAAPRILSRQDAVDDAQKFAAMHDHEHDHAHSHVQANPHLFASPSTAALMVETIAGGLSAVDPGGADVYRANAARLSGELTAMAARMKEAGSRLRNPKVIVSHSIFEYLAADIGLTVVASIEEEDGAEPSASRLAELTALARREGVRAILCDPQGNQALARTLGDEVKIPVVVLDPVESGPTGASLDYYQNAMEGNLKTLLDLLEKNPAGQK